MKIYAPFTPEQVEALNRFQQAGFVHPFTCGDALCRDELVAREDGWHCRRCTYTQNWAHDFMADSKLLTALADGFVRLRLDDA